MKKVLVILVLILTPSFAFASASGLSASASLSSSMTIFAAIGITVAQQMVFPTAVQGQNPTTWDTTMSSAVAGGVNGANGILAITSQGSGTANLSLAATTIGTNYPITFSSVTNTASFALTAASMNVTIKGTINASGTPFVAGTFPATTVCTVKYL